MNSGRIRTLDPRVLEQNLTAELQRLVLELGPMEGPV